jgi:hypothetical protein
MGKTWVLDTETKGTGANMVPLDKVQKKAEAEPRLARRPATAEPARREPARSSKEPVRRSKEPVHSTATPLPPGHVRKKGTGEIGRVQAVDAGAGTATVQWLKRGAASTVPLSSISRR